MGRYECQESTEHAVTLSLLKKFGVYTGGKWGSSSRPRWIRLGVSPIKQRPGYS